MKSTDIMNWLITSEGAFRDPSAWRLLRRMLTDSFIEESWHYALVTGLVWAILHVLLKTRLKPRLIGSWPTSTDIRRDIKYSMSTVMVFSGIAVLVGAMMVSKLAVIYERPLDYGVSWLVFSLPILIVWHDFYFYWTHRLLHTRWLFKHVHSVHHRSRNPSPWSAYAFHPLEALNNGVMFLIAIYALPFNETVLMIFGFHQIIRNALGHAAVETMPAIFADHPLWGQFTTTTHHHLHHETGRGNYGLWFTWWDRCCKTERTDYLKRFYNATTSTIGDKSPLDAKPNDDQQRPPGSMSLTQSASSTSTHMATLETTYLFGTDL